MRFCAYCPEEHNTAEIKECVEKMYKEIYKLQADKDLLMQDLIGIKKAYRDVTGIEYSNTEV